MARDLKKLGKQEELLKLLFDLDGNFIMSRTNLVKIFSRDLSGNIKFLGSDIIYIGSAHSPYVKEDSMTTVGILIYNKFILEDFKAFGYVNKIVDGNFISSLHENLANLFLEDKITDADMDTYLDKTKWLLCGPLSHIINPSLSPEILQLPDSTRKLREKLFKENEGALSKGNAVVAANIETELVNSARTELSKSSETMDIFNSGSGVDFSNNYKTVFIMKGAVPDSREDQSQEFNIVTSNYDDGLTKKDFAANADSLVMGTYAKGKMTGVSGYYTKKYNAMFNRVELQEKGSDCKTSKVIPVTITEENKNLWKKWHYHMVKGQPVLITPENINDYVGKTVMMRTPMCCEAKDPFFCNTCYGDLAYMLNQTRVGTTYALIPNTRMNANLKKFHDMTIKLYEIQIGDLMRFVK